MNFKFNIEEAIQFSKEGCLEEWIHIFLRTFGGNLALSEGLKLEKRNWTGPALVPINQLIRDGNHRLEAMNRLGFKECWVIVWSTD